MPPGGQMGGMELWAIIPELLLAGLVLVLLPLGAFVPKRRQGLTVWIALAGLAAAAVASARMLPWPAQPVFLATYAADPFATYFKLVAICSTALVLPATYHRFAAGPHAAEVPAILVLVCLGMVGLAASQDLVLIALFIQLVATGSYLLVGLAKDDRRATEGALKLFLFSAASGAVMLYGMTVLYGLSGALRLPDLGTQLAAAPPFALLAALVLVLAGYSFEATLVPFHAWAPDTYQGAQAPVAGFLAVGPKAAALAALLRTAVVALPAGLGYWPEGLAALAAVTMTAGNLFALRQTSAKRLLAYSSIAQAGYLMVGIATAQQDALAIPALLVYLAAYLFMNLGAFLAVDAIERETDSDDLASFAGQGRALPLPAAVLALSLLALAGFPPLGGFIGKTMLFGAALGAGWTWLAVALAANVALSLFYYLRVIEALYLRDPHALTGQLPADPPLRPVSPLAGRIALVVAAMGTVAIGMFPEPWVALASRAATILLASGP